MAPVAVTMGSGLDVEQSPVNIGESHGLAGAVTAEQFAKWYAQQELNPPRSTAAIDVSDTTVPKTVPTPQIPPGLAEVVTAWRDLTEPLKVAVLAIIRSVKGGGRGNA